jgi:hypothetical protein
MTTPRFGGVWSGCKNYRNLEKALDKLFRNYPPRAGKN